MPAWGKFWLSVLNVYDWDGNHSIPPELWLQPTFSPLHPSKLWCHTRAVYTPMSYLYGIRYKAPLTDLILELREELYPEPYDTIQWSLHRSNVSPVDMYVTPTNFVENLNRYDQFNSRSHICLRKAPKRVHPNPGIKKSVRSSPLRR